MLAAAHRVFFSPAVPVNPKDEGYINAFAVRLIDGHWLPYVDAVSHRGPMLYWVAAVAAALGDRTSFVPIRTLALLCSLLIVAFTFAAAWRARRPLAGAIAALGIVVALVLEMIPDDGLAYNGEPLLDVFTLAGLLCLTSGLARDRARPSVPLVAAAGALAAWQRWRLLLALAAGAAVPVGIVLARYAIAGELRTLYFYTVTYNSKFYMAPYTPSKALHDLGAWMAGHGLVVAGAAAPSCKPCPGSRCSPACCSRKRSA